MESLSFTTSLITTKEAILDIKKSLVSKKQKCIFAVVAGIFIFIGIGGFGVVGLLKSNKIISLHETNKVFKWLSSAMGKVSGNKPFWALWGISISGIGIGGGFIALGSYYVHITKQKESIFWNYEKLTLEQQKMTSELQTLKEPCDLQVENEELLQDSHQNLASEAHRKKVEELTKSNQDLSKAQAQLNALLQEYAALQQSQKTSLDHKVEHSSLEHITSENILDLFTENLSSLFAEGSPEYENIRQTFNRQTFDGKDKTGVFCYQFRYRNGESEYTYIIEKDSLLKCTPWRKVANPPDREQNLMRKILVHELSMKEAIVFWSGR